MKVATLASAVAIKNVPMAIEIGSVGKLIPSNSSPLPVTTIAIIAIPAQTDKAAAIYKNMCITLP
jgi:hypothetical protein